MLKRTFYTLLIVMSGVSVQAQQDPQFTQYMLNNLYVTPAYAGVEGVTQLTAIHRSQWQGYQSSFGDGGAPTTQMVSFTAPVYKVRGGFGTYIVNDQLGPQNNLEAQAMFAYHLGIKDSKLSFGMKAGIYSVSINGTYYRYIQDGDPQIITGKESQVRPDLGFGLFYRSEKYYMGFGINHLLKSQFDFGLNEARNALENHMNFTAGYFYEVNFDLKLNPTVLVKTDFKEYSFDLGLIATLKDKMWAGLSFRQSEAANVMLGYSFLKDKALKFGYAIDVVVKDQEAKENFSHELLLSYQLPVAINSGKKVVRTPRYRH
ncbi:type IX secretion system membrane protein PorP/SprF [Fulvivirgaceae bacterium PWU4]|uniref:Type IX secretion system membrane protein PorP/SprF n=1 Tax=Chryseosolibacter histidini TaxID=2782349 RepID=A0AAP2DQR9_9BACT|nr:type IX secretion system membrane protein PorP/SprF [Chryseosolibacter histidini]MBT1699829.1 type IX secretion system membrane protein PorP/SprF [Chryseosolibacter histidini]